MRVSGGTDLIGDNLLLTASPTTLDGGGLIFADGGSPEFGLNIWGNSPGSYTAFVAGGGPGFYNSFDATFTLTDVPEPGAVTILAIMLVGVVGFAGFLKKRAA